ncbi:GTP cyclohydrolase [Asanoa ishikariensis]|uniref:GTP cyclohydrolase FolE2 n=1 Tax=Asanoa ishikariensis TaxID=137265 RepID=A0A1H3UB73_9ACTN|nr:GTP cyclohydrolase FolE2 [Asanoa ishikariensis]GIF63926.1 GTP cyclohydrolase [Asanoa ishikariensis]SDZ59646.1 GTP cyclohydrolase I [Asanoa ishikariensis]
MLPDVQGLSDERGVTLDDVGIEGLRYPLLIADGQGVKRETVATVDMSVGIEADVKGAHLSRFVEVLHAWRDQLDATSAISLAEDVRTRLGTRDARVRLSFAYFLERRAPVTGACSFSEYQCTLTVATSGGAASLLLQVRVPVTSVCPCSKAISDRGAHNQRGYVTIEVEPATGAQLWFDDLIDVAEASASSPVYALLKRPDERHVTMAGYDNPVFVEDMARHVAVVLRGDVRIARFRARVVNDESIHNHAAFARLDWTATDDGNA